MFHFGLNPVFKSLLHLTNLAGTPTYVLLGKQSSFTHATAPILLQSPTFTEGKTEALEPTNTPSPNLAFPEMETNGDIVEYLPITESWPIEQFKLI